MKNLKNLFLLLIGFVGIARAYDNQDFMAAVQAGNVDDIARLFEEAVVDVNMQDDFGVTPLMYAIMAKHTDIIQLLLEKGASVNIQDENGKTALFYARNLDAIQLLIYYGANINHQDASGAIILNEIAYTEFADWYQIHDNNQATLDTIEFLLESGLNVNLKDKQGHTVLSYIKVEGSYPKTVALLASYGAIE